MIELNNNFSEKLKDDYITEEDIWNELSTSEKEERLSGIDKLKESVFTDWNQYDLDYLSDYLETKWQFQSSGEALAIMKMIDFYRTHK